MILQSPILSGSVQINNQSLDQFVSASVVSQSLGGGGGADADLGIYGLVGLEQEYYAIAATSS
jgi:hypothetical protein